MNIKTFTIALSTIILIGITQTSYGDWLSELEAADKQIELERQEKQKQQTQKIIENRQAIVAMCRKLTAKPRLTYIAKTQLSRILRGDPDRIRLVSVQIANDTFFGPSCTATIAHPRGTAYCTINLNTIVNNAISGVYKCR